LIKSIGKNRDGRTRLDFAELFYRHKIDFRPAPCARVRFRFCKPCRRKWLQHLRFPLFDAGRSRCVRDAPEEINDSRWRYEVAPMNVW
jgi:hypothetical protein